MRRLIFLTSFAVGCGQASPPRPCADTTAPPASAEAVCGHLDLLGCDFELSDVTMDGVDAGAVCFVAYDEWSRGVPASAFARVTHCYLRSTSCELVDGCNRTCGEGGGPVTIRDAGMPTDAATDSGEPADAGADSGEPADAGADSGEPADAGTESDAAADAAIESDAALASDAA